MILTSLDTVSIIGNRERLRKAVGSGHVSQEQLERFEYDDVHRVLNQTQGFIPKKMVIVFYAPILSSRLDPDRSAKVTLMEDGILLTPAPYSAPAALITFH